MGQQIKILNKGNVTLTVTSNLDSSNSYSNKDNFFAVESITITDPRETVNVTAGDGSTLNEFVETGLDQEATIEVAIKIIDKDFVNYINGVNANSRSDTLNVVVSSDKADDDDIVWSISLLTAKPKKKILPASIGDGADNTLEVMFSASPDNLKGKLV